jgi:translation initiation factor 3 subunit D
LEQQEQQELDKWSLFTNDQLLSSLMTLKYSNFPWEMEINKSGKILIMDRLNEQIGYAELLTQNENFSGNLPDEEKDMHKLCVESTNVNKYFQHQVCHKDDQAYGEESDHPGAYKYRKWNIDNGEVSVFLRSTIDALVETSEGELEECMVKTLNEHDLNASNWRKKFKDNQKGHIFSSEMKNQTCKIAKWII